MMEDHRESSGAAQVHMALSIIGHAKVTSRPDPSDYS